MLAEFLNEYTIGIFICEGLKVTIQTCLTVYFEQLLFFYAFILHGIFQQSLFLLSLLIRLDMCIYTAKPIFQQHKLHCLLPLRDKRK